MVTGILATFYILRLCSLVRLEMVFKVVVLIKSFISAVTLEILHVRMSSLVS